MDSILNEATTLYELTPEDRHFMLNLVRMFPHLTVKFEALPRILRALAHIVEHDDELRRITSEFVDCLNKGVTR